MGSAGQYCHETVFAVLYEGELCSPAEPLYGEMLALFAVLQEMAV